MGNTSSQPNGTSERHMGPRIKSDSTAVCWPGMSKIKGSSKNNKSPGFPPLSPHSNRKTSSKSEKSGSNASNPSRRRLAIPIFRVLRSAKSGHHLRQESPPQFIPEDVEEALIQSDINDEMLRSGTLMDVLIYSLRRYTFSPARNPRHILEVRTASPKWITGMARNNPGAEVVGLTPPGFPVDDPCYPTNIRFIETSFVKGIPFPDGYFDHAFTFSVLRYLPRDRVPQAFIEFFRVVRPGGWFEWWEHPNVIENLGPAGQRSSMAFRRYLMSKNSAITLSETIPTILAETGFVDIQTRTATIPIGDWGGGQGTAALMSALTLGRTCVDLMRMDGDTDAANSLAQDVDLWEEESPYYQSTALIAFTVARKP